MGATDGTWNAEPYWIRTAGRKEEEAVVISVEDLARTLIDTNKFLETGTWGALDVPGSFPCCGTPGRAWNCCVSWG